MAKWATEGHRRVTNDPDDWRWADADGVQNIVDEWELVSSLSSGSLPHYTLVWKRGWQEWLPACQVAELASAIPPDKKETPVAPKLEAGRKQPPPPPVDKYAAYQSRDAASKLMPRGKNAPTRPPPPPNRGIAAPGSRRKSKTPPPPAMRPRTPLPTLVEAPASPTTATLIPPGAVPPPPRGVPTPAPRQPGAATPKPGAVETRAPTATQTPLPVVPPAPRRKPAEPPPPKKKPVEELVEIESQELKTLPTNEPPTMPIATPGPIEVREKSEPPPPAKEAPTGPLPPVPKPPTRRPSSFPSEAPPRSPPPTFWLLVGVGGLAILVMIGVAIVLAVRPDPIAPAPSASVAADAASTAVSTLPCTLGASAKKLAPSIFHGIPPYVSADKDGKRVLIGFAASQNDAVGIAIDPETLEFEQRFKQQSQEAITAVVPLTAGEKVSFAVDRESGGLRFARSIDAQPPITIGVGDDGFASVIGGGIPRTIWEGKSDRRITEPRVANADGAGYAVTFRRGGLSGEVVAGWFGKDGTKQSELLPVATSRKLIGTPVLAANDRDILVAFAARPGPTAYWGLQVGTARHGELPKRAHPFAIPPGGLGAEAISPAVTGLDGGRWILQWTEGSTGNRQVRLQTLGSDLNGLGDPLIVSPREVNAGQGVVWVRGGRGLSLFLVKVPDGHELWGAGLKCP